MLPIAGVGIGMLLVPVTSVPLTVVPPERSGMAASATNTSREMGAVFGVAVLGAIVNAKLTGDLAARLKAIGIPPNFQSLVDPRRADRRRRSGGAASSAEHSKNAAVARIATKVVNAAYDAFGSGLHEALVLSGGLILVGAVVALVTIHRSPGRPRRRSEVEGLSRLRQPGRDALGLPHGVRCRHGTRDEADPLGPIGTPCGSYGFKLLTKRRQG